MPDLMKRMFYTPSMWRILRLFNEGDFGITSGFRLKHSKESNLISQLRLGHKLSERGYDYVPHLGSWHGVQERSFFIPGIAKDEVRSLAHEFDQEAYIWGTKGHWRCHNTVADQVLAEGEDTRILAPDSEFTRYSKMLHRKYELSKSLESLAGLEGEQNMRTAKAARRELIRLEERLRRILI